MRQCRNFHHPRTSARLRTRVYCPPTPSSVKSRQTGPRRRCAGEVLAPHMRGGGAVVAGHPDLEGGGAPSERHLSQLSGHAVTGCSVAAAAVASVSRLDRAACQHRPIRGQVLAGHRQAEVIEAAERGQIRRAEGSVVHVEVFWMASVRTSTIRGPRSLSPPGYHYRSTPSSVKSPETTPLKGT